MKSQSARSLMLAGCLILTLTQCVPQRSVYRGQAGVGDYRVTEIEGCEYITLHFHESTSITHKGNCKNPIHQCK